MTAAESAAESLVGALLELHVGAVAAGGACVARHAGRVVFVRHALPGEHVRALVTEDRGGRYCRADAVEVLEASPDRVEPPCPYARPGRCGGCDWQHADGAAQRRLKAEVIRDQFARLAGIELPAFEVAELPGDLLGWRTRVAYAVDRAGRPGLHRHRSHEIEPVDRCLLGAPGVGDAAALSRPWPGLLGIEPARGDAGDLALIEHRSGGRRTRGRRPPDRLAVIEGPARLRHDVLGRSFEAAAEGFWQVHPAAASTLAQALLDALAPAPGERVLDLYAGAGALTAALAQAVGEAGHVLAVEAAPSAVDDARRNLADLTWVQVEAARVDARWLADPEFRPDLVVLDPPRAGAGAEVMRALLALAPRAVGYVSCDPATLARDVAAAREAGWRLAALRAFDAFPMTHHVECVATLRPDIDRSAP